MWIFRYLRELGTWAFTRWRVHQAIVGALLILGGLVGVTRFSVQPQAIGGYLLCWLIFLAFVIAPARLWHEQDQRLQPGVVFVHHEDDGAVDFNTGVQYARVTVKNRGAFLLTGVEVVLASIEPVQPFAQSVEIEGLYRRAGASVTLRAIEAPNSHAFWNETRYFPETMGLAVEFFRRTLIKAK